MKNIKNLLSIILLSLSCWNLAAANTQVNTPTPVYERMIVFGDSYSDNGNVYRLTRGKYPNDIRYFQGRFSDGPVWTEYLAQDFHLNPDDRNQFINYAYGQAKVLAPASITVSGHPDKDYVIPSLSQQINTFLKQHENFNEKDIVVVFIAANDFFDIPNHQAQLFFKNIADEEAKQIDRLIQAGARHIIVLNGREVTRSPLATIVAEKNVAPGRNDLANQFIKNAQGLVQIYNNNLARNLQAKPPVFIYDTYQFDHSILTKIDQGGFHYKMHSTPAVMQYANTSCYQNNQGDYQNIAGVVCNDPQHYFFYDRIHTTHFVNYLLAQDVFKQFQHSLSQ